MNITGLTLTNILSGNLNLNTANIKFGISPNSFYGINYIDQLTNIDFTTDNIQKVVAVDTGAYSYSRSAYLSTRNIFFSDINKDYQSLGINYVTVFAYLDTGVASTSYILASQQIYSPEFYGPTTYNFSNADGNRFLFLRDNSNTATLYRSFREGLLKASYGNLRTKTIKYILLDSTYTFDITHSTYANIPAGSIIAETSVDTPRLYISDDGTLKIFGTNVLTFNTPTTKIVKSIVIYIDEQPLGKPLIGYISSINPTDYSTNSTTSYMRMNGNIIFSL
jgi:hypothetical protein